MRRVLLLPCLCACLSVSVQKQEGQRVLEEQEEAEQEEAARPESQVKRRSLPALTEPFTTTLAELLRPGEVPAEVQDQLAASLLGLPAQLQKEWDGFHYWLPRLEANAERRRLDGEGKGAYLKDANYYSRDRRSAEREESEDLQQAIADLDSALSTIQSDNEDSDDRQEARSHEELYGHSHGPHGGKSQTYRRIHGKAKRSAKALGALAHLDRMLGVLGEEREEDGLEELRGAAAGVAAAWQEVEDGGTETAYEELLKAEVQLKKIMKNLEKSETKEIGTEAAEKMLDSALHRLYQDGAGDGRRASKSKRSAGAVEEPAMSAEALAWLEDQYNLTRADVAEIQSLPESEFLQLEAALEELQLQEADLEGGVGLLDILREARQLVPLEVEAAAAGVLELGRHLGDLAMAEARPAYRLVAGHSSALLNTAADNVPDDVAAWAEEGGDLATRYLGPRLARLGAAVERIQGQLVEAAEDAGPRVVPALQAMAEELRDVIQAARETVGETVTPALERAGRNLEAAVPEEVKEHVKPVAAGLSGLYTEGRQELVTLYAETGRPLVEEGRFGVARLGHAIKHKVAPAIKNAVKKTLHGVFTGLPRLVQKLSREAHGAAKVFRGRYSDKLAKLRSKKPDPVQML